MHFTSADLQKFTDLNEVKKKVTIASIILVFFEINWQGREKYIY